MTFEEALKALKEGKKVRKKRGTLDGM